MNKTRTTHAEIFIYYTTCLKPGTLQNKLELRPRPACPRPLAERPLLMVPKTDAGGGGAVGAHARVPDNPVRFLLRATPVRHAKTQFDEATAVAMKCRKTLFFFRKKCVTNARSGHHAEVNCGRQGEPEHGLQSPATRQNRYATRRR